MLRLLDAFYSLQTTADLLGCVPDIACYGKLLTGGVIPLAATLATNAVFDSFVGDSKVVYSVDWFVWKMKNRTIFNTGLPFFLRKENENQVLGVKCGRGCHLTQS